jgi:hypothetical protein
METAKTARRRRPVWAALGAVTLAAGLLPAAAVLSVTRQLAATPSAGIDWIARSVVLAAGFAPSLAGASLLLWALPGALPRLARRVRQILSRQTRPSWKLIGHPLVQVAAAAVAIAAAMGLAGEAWPLVAVAVTTTLAVTVPLACVFARSWWLATALSSAALAVALVALGATGPVRDLGEEAMVFLLPVMVYPVAVLLGGLGRLVLWARARGRGGA